ncbi:hypothetical protein VTP01DRAFT_10188 [Rhizomucor pusillus]|uniref:uncharacterized protein n=1 Tax=Rhizomucor pusillus TaxID=4840 RepID=UPI0037440808
MPVSKIVATPHLGFITPEKFLRTAPSLAIWGAAAGTALALLGSDVPLVKKDILSKLPVLGSHFAVPEPAQDEE